MSTQDRVDAMVVITLRPSPMPNKMEPYPRLMILTQELTSQMTSAQMTQDTRRTISSSLVVSRELILVTDLRLQWLNNQYQLVFLLTVNSWELQLLSTHWRK